MPADGLVGWWRLLDGFGTVASDSSGNNDDGNLVGTPTWINTGPNGGGLSFRGNPFTDSVRIATSVVLEPAAVTISVWIKGPQIQAFANQGVFGKAFDNDQSDPFQSYQIAVSSTLGQTSALFTLGGAANDLVVSGVVADDTVWQNFAATYNPAGIAPQKLFYLNGVLIGSLTLNTAIQYDSTPLGDLYIAANSDLTHATKTYQGSITDVRVYDRALSPAELLDIFNGTDSQISGNAGTGNATIHYSGPVTGTVTADALGNYVIPNLPNGTYTITPTKTGFTFVPPSRIVVISGDNVVNVDFTVTVFSVTTISVIKGPHRGSRVTPPYNP